MKALTTLFAPLPRGASTGSAQTLRHLLGMTLGAWCLFLATSQATGGESVMVSLSTYEEWLKGEPIGVTVTREGEVRLGMTFRQIATADYLSAETVWSAATDKKGNTYLGTGPNGVILKVDATGKLSQFAKLEQGHVYALAVGPDDLVYAAGSPWGKVVKLDASGQASEYFNTGEQFVWALLWDKQMLYAATGTHGKLWRIAGEHKATLAYDSEAPHLRCLALDRSGKLLLGTDGRGVILRLDEDNKAFALCDVPRKEIRQIAVDETGRIAFTAYGEEPAPDKSKRNRPSGTPAAPSSSNGSPLAPDMQNAAAGKPDLRAIVSAMKPKDLSSSKEGKGAVYLLEAPGFVRPLWTGDSVPHSLARQDGEWLIGTGGDGFLFGVNDRGEERLVARAQADQITLLHSIQGSLFAATSQPAGWVKLEKAAPHGTYRSDVIDSGSRSTWGAMRFKGKPAAVRTRSGNTADPDKTWTEWAPLAQGKIATEPSRYLQYELQILDAPVRSVDLFYTPANLKPEVQKLLVLPPGIGYKIIENPPQPPQQKTVLQILKASSAPEMSLESKRLAPMERTGLRTLVWNSTDPNSDELEYRLEYRKLDDQDYTLLEADLRDNAYTLDTSGWTDGHYLFRVTASDSPSNPGKALSASLVSEPALVDNTPPKVTLVRSTPTEAEFSAQDASSLLWESDYSTDGIHYYPVQPVDGVLDSHSESFVIPRTKDQPIFFRVQDENANTAGTHAPKP